MKLEKERIKYDKLTGWKRTIENARQDERKQFRKQIVGMIRMLKNTKQEMMPSYMIIKDLERIKRWSEL